MTAPSRTARVLVLGALDGFANGVRPVEVMRYLARRGHDVQLMDTRSLSRASPHRTSPLYRAPSWRPLRAALWLIEILVWLVGRRPQARRWFSYRLLVLEQELRRRILRPPVAAAGADLVICAMPQDSAALLDVSEAATLYDCPTPWADELYNEGRLTDRQRTRMRARERTIYEAVDHLVFFWRTYGWYVRDRYGVERDEITVLDYGCEPAERRARYADPPRIVYLGSLSSRFINLPLLASLTRQYPHIDVYGGPPPDPALGLRYLGYSPPAILGEYQLGLITCTEDDLRREGFSAKHLGYLAAGLPVLVPGWRRHLHLLRGSVPYDEASFAATVSGFADPGAWQLASDEAYAQAQELAWERTLRPLDSIVAAAVERTSLEERQVMATSALHGSRRRYPAGRSRS